MSDEEDANNDAMRLDLDVGDQKATPRADAIRWTCSSFPQMNEDEFIKAADSRSLIQKATKFSPEAFQAMCDDANIGQGGQELV